jgi:hypothetical protein
MPSTYESDNTSDENKAYAEAIAKSLVDMENDLHVNFPADMSFIFRNFDNNDPLVVIYEQIPKISYSHDGFISQFKLNSKHATWF